jgi:hypothetical protein
MKKNIALRVPFRPNDQRQYRRQLCRTNEQRHSQLTIRASDLSRAGFARSRDYRSTNISPVCRDRILIPGSKMDRAISADEESTKA